MLPPLQSQHGAPRAVVELLFVLEVESLVLALSPPDPQLLHEPLVRPHAFPRPPLSDVALDCQPPSNFMHIFRLLADAMQD